MVAQPTGFALIGSKAGFEKDRILSAARKLLQILIGPDWGISAGCARKNLENLSPELAIPPPSCPACAGHPRRPAGASLESFSRRRRVDGRDKPGHDDRGWKQDASRIALHALYLGQPCLSQERMQRKSWNVQKMFL
jgi:hypothetical protein